MIFCMPHQFSSFFRVFLSGMVTESDQQFRDSQFRTPSTLTGSQFRTRSFHYVTSLVKTRKHEASVLCCVV